MGVKVVEDLGNYLGVPSVFSKNKSKDFGYIMRIRYGKLCKVGKVLFFFSVVGKEILIKSVGQTIPSYVMSIFKLLK